MEETGVWDNASWSIIPVANLGHNNDIWSTFKLRKHPVLLLCLFLFIFLLYLNDLDGTGLGCPPIDPNHQCVTTLELVSITYKSFCKTNLSWSQYFCLSLLWIPCCKPSGQWGWIRLRKEIREPQITIPQINTTHTPDMNQRSSSKTIIYIYSIRQT